MKTHKSKDVKRSLIHAQKKLKMLSNFFEDEKKLWNKTPEEIAAIIKKSNSGDFYFNPSVLKGRSLPSRRFCCWIVNEVSGDINGRARLVTGDLKGEQWVWNRDLIQWFSELDSITNDMEDSFAVMNRHNDDSKS